MAPYATGAGRQMLARFILCIFVLSVRDMPDKTPDNLRILFYWFGRRLIAWPGSVRELLNRAGAASDTERCAGRTLCTNNAGNVRKTCDFVQKTIKTHGFRAKIARIFNQKTGAFSRQQPQAEPGRPLCHPLRAACIRYARTGAKRPHKHPQRG